MKRGLMTFKHYLLTRFNVGLYGKKQKTLAKDVIDPDEWMENRINLFKTFCAPSVEKQTCKNFIWMIVVDKDTNPAHIEAIVDASPLNCKVVPGDNFREAAKTFIGKPDVDRVITTRMDNDDAIHRDFVANIHGWFRRKEKTGVLTYPTGWILNDKKQTLHHVRYIKNPFTSLVEKCDRKVRTILFNRHTEVINYYKLHVLHHEHMWCQVVHGDNLANHSWGHKVNVRKLRKEEYWL